MEFKPRHKPQQHADSKDPSDPRNLSDSELLIKVNEVPTNPINNEPPINPTKRHLTGRDIAVATAITSTAGVVALEQMEPGTIAETAYRLRTQPIKTLAETAETVAYAPRGIIKGTGELFSDVSSDAAGYAVRGTIRVLTFESLAACATNNCEVPSHEVNYAIPPRPLVAAESVMTAAVAIAGIGMVFKAVGNRRK